MRRFVTGFVAAAAVHAPRLTARGDEPAVRGEGDGGDVVLVPLQALQRVAIGDGGDAPNIRFCGDFMRPGRLELPPRIRGTRPSTLRVYQFRHRRVVAGDYRRGMGIGPRGVEVVRTAG